MLFSGNGSHNGFTFQFINEGQRFRITTSNTVHPRSSRSSTRANFTTSVISLDGLDAERTRNKLRITTALAGYYGVQQATA